MDYYCLVYTVTFNFVANSKISPGGNLYGWYTVYQNDLWFVWITKPQALTSVNLTMWRKIDEHSSSYGAQVLIYRFIFLSEIFTWPDTTISGFRYTIWYKLSFFSSIWIQSQRNSKVARYIVIRQNYFVS